uniref:Histidine N-acetyltransferase C-terminal domain-containing protein n=1 Tax=Xenopus tropicalis TaxID=8364 RepID=A0A1B8Y903_XENTR
MEDSIKALRLRVKRDYVGAPPVVLSPLEVLDLFENPCILEHLFPKGLLIGGSLPLAAHKCNLKLMLGSGLLWIYSKSTHSYTPSSSVTQCSHPAPTHINPPPQHPPLPHVSPELLSLSSAPIPVPLAKGTHCLNIDLFGTNPRFVQGHILHHLVMQIPVLPPGGSVICVIVAEETLRGAVTDFLQGITPFHTRKNLLVLEGSLQNPYLPHIKAKM